MANQLIIKEFDTANERGPIDGVVSHIYSTAPDNIDSQYFDFQIIEKTWGEIFDGLTNYVTEWNLRSNTSVLDKHEDYALKQAHELINMAEVFVENNVEVAHILNVQHKSAANLSGDEGKTEMSIPGEMFRMLTKNLPGTRLVGLTDGFSNETEAKDSPADVHLFHSDEKMVPISPRRRNIPAPTALIFSSVMTSTGAVTITRIGVAQGQPPGAYNS